MTRSIWIGLLSLLITTSAGLAGTSNSLMDVSPNGKALIVANNEIQSHAIGETNLRIRLEEYLPFGLNPGVIYVT